MSIDKFPKIKSAATEDASVLTSEEMTSTQEGGVLVSLEEQMSDADYEALKTRAAKLKEELKPFENKMENNERTREMDSIKIEFARILNNVLARGVREPQFADEIEALEKWRGLKPGIDGSSLAVTAAMSGMYARGERPLRSLFGIDQLERYSALSRANHQERLETLPREQYKELEEAERKLEAEEARRHLLETSPKV